MEWTGSTKWNIPAIFGMHSFHQIGGMYTFHLLTAPQIFLLYEKISSDPLILSSPSSLPSPGGAATKAKSGNQNIYRRGDGRPAG
jgi:hypothetical protein